MGLCGGFHCNSVGLLVASNAGVSRDPAEVDAVAGGGDVGEGVDDAEGVSVGDGVPVSGEASEKALGVSV